MIAESDLNDPRLVSPLERGGYGLDAQWSDDLHHALHALLTGDRAGYYSDFGSVEHLAKALRNGFVYDGIYSQFRKRRHGRRPVGLDSRRFLGYLQNHDQIGNRAAGERSSVLMSPELLKVGAALVLMSPFVPMLFQGEEWAASSPFLYFTDHRDKALGTAVSEGRKNEFAAFGWDPSEIPDPQDPETFRRSKLDWDELRSGMHAELFDWHRALIQFRANEVPTGDLAQVHVRFDDADRWLVMARDRVTVVCNFAANDVRIDQDVVGDIVLASSSEPKHENGGMIVPAESVTIYSD